MSQDIAPSPPRAQAGKITRVRVYIDRAAITRVRRFEQPQAEVVFTPLPLELEAQTLRARAFVERAGSTPEPVEVLGVSAQLAFAEVQTERQRQVSERLNAVEARLQTLDDLESTERHMRRLLSSYAEIATHTLSREWLEREPSFEKWGATFDQLRAGTERVSTESALRRQERAKLQEEKARLLEEEHRLGKPERIGWRAVVSLPLIQRPGELTVELSYLSHKAQWMPIYDARHLLEGGERLRLTSVALVRQTTGEDWEDVELIATTARPPLSEPPPELARVGLRGAVGAADKRVLASQKQEARLGGAGATPSGAEPSFEHQAPGRVRVPANARPTRVELFEVELPCRSRLEVAALDRPVAVQVAELDNTSGRVLLPGRVNLFRGPHYVGQTGLGFVTPDERFRLALGTESAVRVRREVKESEERQSLLGSGAKLYEVRTVLENLGARPLSVWLRDRVPVSRAAGTAVKLEKVDPGLEISGETGLCAQQVELAPRARRELLLSFRLSARGGAPLETPLAV